MNPYRADEDEADSRIVDEQRAPHFTSPSLFVPSSVPPDVAVTNSKRDVPFQAPILDFDAFSAFPDWEWAAEVPLGDVTDLSTMSFLGAEFD